MDINSLQNVIEKLIYHDRITFFSVLKFKAVVLKFSHNIFFSTSTFVLNCVVSHI